jgi:hypothetical protein
VSTNDLEIVQKDTAELVPYVNNAKVHSQEQITRIMSSIKEFGFNNPILLDGDNGVIAGHGRLMAAQKLGMTTVPCVELCHLSGAQKKAYILADNRLAEVGAEWNEDVLAIELEGLDAMDFDLDMIGFGDFGVGEGSGTEDVDRYSSDIKVPMYEPGDIIPEISELYDTEKSDTLKGEILEHNFPSEIENFLLAAADRMTVFYFDKIADFYANSDRELQDVFEMLALVIIDFQKAYENGYVVLSERIKKSMIKDHGDE